MLFVILELAGCCVSKESKLRTATDNITNGTNSHYGTLRARVRRDFTADFFYVQKNAHA